jgi:hypothetical protein
MKCLYCERTNDLRPYGPKGAFVCFKCATETPEREACASEQFTSQLMACGENAVVIGHEHGPVPLDAREGSS